MLLHIPVSQLAKQNFCAIIEIGRSNASLLGSCVSWQIARICQVDPLGRSPGEGDRGQKGDPLGELLALAEARVLGLRR